MCDTELKMYLSNGHYVSIAKLHPNALDPNIET